MSSQGRTPIRLLLVAALVVAVLAAGGPDGRGPDPAAAQAPTALVDRWSGTWEVTFTTDGNGGQRTAGPLSMDVARLTTEQGLALARGTTGDLRNGSLTDFVCGAGDGSTRLFFEARPPFEFVSGHTGVVPGPDVPTMGAHVFFCTDDADTAIRGQYANDLGAFDPLIQKPVAHGDLLARRGSGQEFEGSVSRFPGDFPGPAFHTTWQGTCRSGPCRQVFSRPRLRAVKLSTYNALLAFLRGTRGARLELTRPDGSARPVRLGENIDLEDGDVVTSHGMYADVRIIRADGTEVTIAIEPGGAISGVSDPGLIRHRGGRIIAGSAAGFTSDSSVWDPGPNAQQAGARPTVSVLTTVTGGRVALALDSSRRTLTVENLGGKVEVRAGGTTLAVPRGGDAVATARRVRRLAPPADLARAIPSPRAITAGAVTLYFPRKLTTRALSRARCLGVRLRGSGTALARVTLLTGTARRGTVVSQRTAAVAAAAVRGLCLRLSAKARGIPAGTPLTVALGTRAGTSRRLATGRVVLVTG